MWYVRDVLYAVLYVRVSCFVVRGCGVSRRYIDVCYCDMFSVVNVYLDHLKFYVVCINSRRSFFDIVDKGLRVKLTELWMKNSKPPPGPGPVVLGCSSGCWDFSILP